jgi:hypothetical protein
MRKSCAWMPLIFVAGCADIKRCIYDRGWKDEAITSMNKVMATSICSISIDKAFVRAWFPVPVVPIYIAVPERKMTILLIRIHSHHTCTVHHQKGPLDLFTSRSSSGVNTILSDCGATGVEYHGLSILSPLMILYLPLKRQKWVSCDWRGIWMNGGHAMNMTHCQRRTRWTSPWGSLNVMDWYRKG